MVRPSPVTYSPTFLTAIRPRMYSDVFEVSWTSMNSPTLGGDSLYAPVRHDAMDTEADRRAGLGLRPRPEGRAADLARLFAPALPARISRAAKGEKNGEEQQCD